MAKRKSEFQVLLEGLIKEKKKQGSSVTLEGLGMPSCANTFVSVARSNSFIAINLEGTSLAALKAALVAYEKNSKGKKR